jgi:hypothetical protein
MLFLFPCNFNVLKKSYIFWNIKIIHIHCTEIEKGKETHRRKFYHPEIQIFKNVLHFLSDAIWIVIYIYIILW